MRELSFNAKILCGVQAWIFVQSLQETWCSDEFIYRFMNSEVGCELDKDYALYMKLSDKNPYQRLVDEFGPYSSDDGAPYMHDQMAWMGYLYKYWAYTREMSNKGIYALVKPEVLVKAYDLCHTLDMEDAIRQIKEKNGIEDYEDEIARGVKFLREYLRKQKEAEAAADTAYEDEP
ncbi:MAG: hypothetical protein LUD50_05525 [Clostridia bacterium]|nr:hypothetical protein [Clostridia bacterium]